MITTIVGVGALGSNFIQFARNLNTSLRIIDFDRVEQKNVLSQFHSKTNIGKSKVTSIQQTMNFLFGKKVEIASNNKLVEDNAKQLLSGSGLVVDCLDNGQSRILVQNFVRKHNIPCLHGALAADGSFGRVIWDEQFSIDSELGQGNATCEDGAHLPFIAITAGYLAKATQDFLLSGKKNGYQITPAGTIKI